MSLAALGCNPEDTGASLDDVGGHQPGTLAFSPDGGLYCLFQAGEAIAQYDTCLVYGAWRVRPLDVADDHSASTMLCIPQVEVANAHYAWGLVFGNGTASASADMAASVTQLFPSTDEGRLAGTINGTDDLHACGLQKTAGAVDASADRAFSVAVMWPHLDLIET